jgi:hypothetical protein
MAARTALCSSAIASSTETPTDTSIAFTAALALPAPGLGDHPCRARPAAPGAAEVRLPLVAGDDAGLVADDRLHELVPAGKAVIHLRPAHTRRLDATESGARHAPLVDQPRSRIHDPRADPLPLAVSLGRPCASLHPRRRLWRSHPRRDQRRSGRTRALRTGPAAP